MYIGEAKLETLKALNEAGFQSVEVTSRNATPESAASVRREAEWIGLRIHSVQLRSQTLRQELAWFAIWYNERRPHTTLRGSMPDEVYFRQRPAVCKSTVR